MRRVILSGGPNPMDVRIRDSETGQDLTGMFLSFDVKSDAQKLIRVTLTAFVELEDLAAEVEIMDVGASRTVTP